MRRAGTAGGAPRAAAAVAIGGTVAGMDATRVLLIGIVAGARSSLPFALLSRRGVAGSGLAARALRHPWAGPLTTLAVGGEMVGDKLRATPSRLDGVPLGGRVVVGAVAGSALGGERGSALGGAVLGAVGAVLGAYGLYHARRLVVDRTPLPDAAVGALEDSLILALGRRATR